MKIKFQSS